MSATRTTRRRHRSGSLYPLTLAEGDKLRQVVALLDEATDEDPKYRVVERILLDGIGGTQRWLDRGCILFSQYYDSVRWVAEPPLGAPARRAGGALRQRGGLGPLPGRAVHPDGA